MIAGSVCRHLKIAGRVATGSSAYQPAAPRSCNTTIVSDPLPVVLAQAVSVGGDADTIASIAGQLAGTVVGSAGVPYNLVADIDGSDELGVIGEAFAEFVANNGAACERRNE